MFGRSFCCTHMIAPKGVRSAILEVDDHQRAVPVWMTDAAICAVQDEGERLASLGACMVRITPNR